MSDIKVEIAEAVAAVEAHRADLEPFAIRLVEVASQWASTEWERITEKVVAASPELVNASIDRLPVLKERFQEQRLLRELVRYDHCMGTANDLRRMAEKHYGPPEKHLSGRDAGLLHDAADIIERQAALENHDLPDALNELATKLFTPDQRRIGTNDYSLLLRARNELRDLVQYLEITE